MIKQIANSMTFRLFVPFPYPPLFIGDFQIVKGHDLKLPSSAADTIPEAESRSVAKFMEERRKQLLILQ